MLETTRFLTGSVAWLEKDAIVCACRVIVVWDIERDSLEFGSLPATGRKVDANEPNGVALEDFATEWTGRGETGRGLFDYFFATVLAEYVSCVDDEIGSRKRRKKTDHKGLSVVEDERSSPLSRRRRLNLY